jgi:predicted metal-dependent phosphoesterase TrpH
MIQIDFHCHTIFSKDSLVRPQKLVESCHRKGLHRIVVTDHNTIAGALIAQKLDPQLVIVGEEIMTTEGEILAAFVQEEIPSGLTPGEVISRLRRQGAFISVSHPFDTWRGGAWSMPALQEIAPLVDAIETHNSRCMEPEANQKAQEFARKLSLPGTSGSDAHTCWEIGRATLLLPDFQDVQGLKLALLSSNPQFVSSPLWIHFTSRFAKIYKRLTHFHVSDLQS